MTVKRFGLALILVAALTAINPQPVSAGPWCAQIAVVGDSLTARGNGPLRDRLPGVLMNARGARTLTDGYEAALGVHESNRVDCWVIALGTADLYFDRTSVEIQTGIDQLITLMDPTDHIWWVVPVFCADVPFDPERVASRIPPWAGVQIRLTLGPADYQADGIHLSAGGYVNRAGQIAAAIAD
jgi:hypothetical protein